MKSEDRAAKLLAILDNKDLETNACIRTMKADSLNLQRLGVFVNFWLDLVTTVKINWQLSNGQV